MNDHRCRTTSTLTSCTLQWRSRNHSKLERVVNYSRKSFISFPLPSYPTASTMLPRMVVRFSALQVNLVVLVSFIWNHFKRHDLAGRYRTIGPTDRPLAVSSKNIKDAINNLMKCGFSRSLYTFCSFYIFFSSMLHKLKRQRELVELEEGIQRNTASPTIPGFMEAIDQEVR